MKTFTTAFIKANCGCYCAGNGNLSRLEDVYKEEGKILCYQQENCTVTAQEILDSKIPLKDKYFFFCKKVFNKEQNQQITIAVAEYVLPIYEEKYPNNKAPREAIKSAKLYLAGHISLGQLIIAKNAAYAAAHSARAAYTAHTAAYAAYAAAYTATAHTVYAAHAAYDAYVAYAAVYTIQFKQILQKYVDSIE